MHRLAAIPVAFFLSIFATAAQDSPGPHHLVHDWSNHHIVFTGLTPENVAAVAEFDPRAWQNWMAHSRQRFEHMEANSETATEPDPTWYAQSESRGIGIRRGHRPRQVFADLARDWQISLDSSVGPRVSPAKFSFDINAAPDCANDYVVFPTSSSDVPGAGGSNVRLSVVAFNNLYTGPGPTGICPTPLSPATEPSVLFAYNTSTTTGGKADLSPVLSLDGKKIAFVESNDGAGSNYSAFHVLTWKAGEGSFSGAAAPGNCSTGNSCMTTLVLSATRSASNSSPFVDYAHDIAYVGDDGGRLHKITQVFGGTPVEVTTNGWPVQLNPPFGSILGSPVYDSTSGRIFVTDNSGNLYVVDGAAGTMLKTISVTLFRPSDPIVDSTNETVFVFGSDSSFHLAVWQYDTSGTLLRNVQAGTLSGTVNVYDGTFDNNYFNSPSSGMLYFAGAVNGVASLCAVGFTGSTMNASFSGPLALSTSATTSEPTPLTEIFNPTFSSAKDRLFLGIDANCTGSSPNGCIESLDISNGFPSRILNTLTLGTNGGSFSVSGIVMDNVSSAAQASSIYFEALTPASSAIKLTQSSLQ